MKTVTGDWDGSNSLTMNTFSVILCLSFLTLKVGEKKKWLVLILDVLVGVSASDVVDRLWYDVTTFERNDWVALLVIIIFAFMDFHKKKIHKWLMIFKPYNYLCRKLQR